MDLIPNLAPYLWIDGQFQKPMNGTTFETARPATGELLTEVANATKEDVDIAVKAAKRCLYSDGWGYKSTGKQRADILRKFATIMESRKTEIAMLDVIDEGKPYREAVADVGDAISCANHLADLAEKQDTHQDEILDVGSTDFVCKLRFEPIGVVAAITPWNYPFLMAIWKVIPAIAAGCCVVLKPSELAPLSCLLLGEMLHEAGLPAGALNVLPGLGVTAGAALSEHPEVDKITFTGSGPTARRIMAAAANGPRAFSAELGGKSPLILFDDSHLDAAIDWVVLGILWGSGQVCTATSRLLVHSSIKDTVVERIRARMDAVKIGNTGTEEFIQYAGPQMGPLVSKLQYEKVWKIIEDGKSLGFTHYGGDKSSVASLGNGFFVPPQLFVDPPLDSFIWSEEIFGPVLALRSFETEEEAVTLANDSPYGLGGAVFSADLDRCERVARNLRCVCFIMFVLSLVHCTSLF
jgi:betaine-aldehyde dehydrogenase